MSTENTANMNQEALNGNSVSGNSRKERRKQWFEKKNRSLKKAENVTAKEKTLGKLPVRGGKSDLAASGRVEEESQRTKLRKRENIPKPVNLQYEHNMNRGFHAKIMQNLFADTAKKKKMSQKERAQLKRKLKSQATAEEKQEVKKQKLEVKPEENEVFDSYKFSLKLINGEVDEIKTDKGKDSNNKYVLFIGNLPFDITREQLEEHFRKTGGIKSIRIPRERGTDKGKGFAFMEFDGRISHGIALRLHQTTLAGRKINVEFTSIGGGKSETRKEKLRKKNEKRRKMKMH